MASIFNENERKVRKLRKIALQVEALEEQYKALSDSELRGKTDEFKARLEAESNGRFKVTVQGAGVLGSAQEMFESMQMGGQEIALLPTARISGFSPTLQIFDLPFLFPDLERGARSNEFDYSLRDSGMMLFRLHPNFDGEGEQGMVSFFDFLPKGSALVFQDYFWVHERLEQLGASPLPLPKRGDAGIAEPSSPPWEGLGEASPCLVESEKTALIMSLVCPDKVWLATGGKSNFKASMLEALVGCEVAVYPDADALQDWYTRAMEINRQIGTHLYIPTWYYDLMNHPEARSSGCDLADMVCER